MCKEGASRAYKTVAKNLYRTGKPTNWPVITCILSVTFFVNDLDTDLSPTFWCEVLLQRNSVEDGPDFFFRIVTAVFELLSSYSIAVFRIPSFQSVDGILNLIFCELWNGVELAGIGFVIFSARLHIFFGVSFFNFIQVFVEFRKYICDSLSRLHSFAFFVFDFGDEDSLLH